MALRAIANSGYDGAYLDVTRYLEAPESTVRVAAVRALQSMKDERVEPTLASRFQSDENPEVQTAVLEVLRLRSPTPTAVRVARKALSSNSPHVRHSALALAEDLMLEHPDLSPLLAAMASEDPK